LPTVFGFSFDGNNLLFIEAKTMCVYQHSSEKIFLPVGKRKYSSILCLQHQWRIAPFLFTLFCNSLHFVQQLSTYNVFYTCFARIKNGFYHRKGEYEPSKKYLHWTFEWICKTHECSITHNTSETQRRSHGQTHKL